MKRSGRLFDEICSWENLRTATARALKGKRGKADTRAYMSNLDTNLRRVRTRLLEGNLPLGRFVQFTIHDPKTRLISAPCFEERIVHHAIMNICEPVFEKDLISDTYACRRGKGRVACLVRAASFARQHTHFVKLDIQKYFDSIHHEVLFDKLGRRFKDPRLLNLFRQIIDSHEFARGRGLPIGSLTSQHFANFYLGECDRFIKQSLRTAGYVRYMDDMALWGNSSTELFRSLMSVRDFLAARLQLAVKREPYGNCTHHGMDFLGCRVFSTHMVLNRRSRYRFRAQITRINRDLEIGLISEVQAQRCGQALVAFTRTVGVRSWKFRRSLIVRAEDTSLGVGSGRPRRQLEQQYQELPLREPQQERAGEPEQQPRVPSCRSSTGTDVPQEPAGFPPRKQLRANDGHNLGT